jgi:hypothetical protein
MKTRTERLPKWARTQIEAQEYYAIEQQRKINDLRNRLEAQEQANLALFGREYHEVHVLRKADVPVVTLYQLTKDGTTPIVALRPGDALVVSRRRPV